ncbi:hypothetical protein [Neokomagataea anthophila]|uniref:Uncharacterized protein n=1 Tax=Neokomagataea anthophila TaxID=2826925 RepID=A0ABS5E9A0_9PROT|nr:hypothetical protein [Neokomagataea anthophila]MBR0560480.1 hypothetical protein [Neokomagataea anthophila]
MGITFLKGMADTNPDDDAVWQAAVSTVAPTVHALRADDVARVLRCVRRPDRSDLAQWLHDKRPDLCPRVLSSCA